MPKLWHRYGSDLIAGVTVAFVALPLALAFGVASGAGAAAGLYAAVFGGFVTSVVGGCGVQVSGPTGAMTLVLVRVIKEYGLQGMCVAGAMAGLMQVILGGMGLGRLVRYLPQPVVAALTSGVALLIFASQVGNALSSPVIAAVTVAAIVFALLVAPRIPAALFGLTAGVLVNELLINTPHVVGAVPSTLPKPSLPLLSLAEMNSLVLPAFVICLFGSIEALLSAEVGAAITGQRHDGNRELIGQGLGNMVAAVVGGVPVAGAIDRTVVNAVTSRGLWPRPSREEWPPRRNPGGHSVLEG